MTQRQPRAQRAQTRRRTTHRSSTGTKLYAVRGSDGAIQDIQTYRRAHRADLAHRSQAEIRRGRLRKDSQ